MGSNITPDNMRGFLIPSSIITQENIWEGQSSYSQQNGRSGIAEAQQVGTSMNLSTTGDQEFGVTIETQNGGTPGINASFLWGYNNSIYQYGQDWTGTFTGWDMYAQSSARFYTHTDAVELINGVLFTVSESQPNSTDRLIEVNKKIRGESVVHVADILDASLPSTPNCDAHPIILQMQDDSLYVAHVNYASNDVTNISAYRSFDGGDTWQRITQRALIEDIGLSTYDIKDMRAVTTDNVITLFIEMTQTSGTTKNHVAQYRSLDSGLTYQLVGGVSDNADGKFHACRPVKLKNGYIGMAYIKTPTDIKFRKIPNPGIRLSASSWSDKEVTVTSNISTPVVFYANTVSSELVLGDVACFYANSRVFVFAREYNDGSIYGFYSDDEGDSWQKITQGAILTSLDASIFNFGSWSKNMDHMVATTHEGKVIVLAHRSGDIHSLSFGGYSLLGYPKLSEYPQENQYMKFLHTWTPLGIPSDSSYWTATGAGSQFINQNGLNITTTSTQQRVYDYSSTLPNSFDNGLVLRFRLQVTQGTSTAAAYTGVKFRIETATLGVAITLRISRNGFNLFDHSGQLVSDALNISQQTEFQLRFTGARVAIAYRTYDQNNEKEWVVSEHPVNFFAATGGGSFLQWGHLDASVSTTTSIWQEFCVNPILNTVGYVPNAREVTKRSAFYPEFGEYKYITMGMSISTKQTPARGGDEYNIEPKYDFPIDNIFYQNAMSPRLMWRSQNDEDQQEIAFFTDKGVSTSERSYHETNVYGLHLNNINFQQFILYRRNGASWSQVMQVNSANLNSDFERSGNTIQPRYSGSPFYLKHNEAKGWRCKLISGSNIHIVKIISNTEGVWGQNADKKRATLTFDTDLSPVAGMPTTGVMNLMPNQITLVIDALDDVNNGDVAFKIRIQAQQTLEGYYQIGTMLYGHVAFPAPQYQRGRVISFDANVQQEVTLDNMFYSRKMSDGYRTVSLAWTEPIDTTKIESRDPDYWKFSDTTGSHPVANYGDAASVMHGIARQLNNEIPIVYLPKIQKNNRLQLICRREHHIYCRLDGSVSMESVIGEEGISESFRIGTINLVEVE